MALITPIPEHAERGDVARVYEEIRETLGIAFVPNFFKTISNSPTALRGTWEAYRNASWRGTVPTVLKEMMFVAISVARGCRYCEIAHLALCKLLGCDAATCRSLVKNLDALRPRRNADAVAFAVKAALRPAEIADADYQALRDHGISDAEIAEILAMTAFSMYATTLADAFQLSPDAEFEHIVASARSRRVAGASQFRRCDAQHRGLHDCPLRAAHRRAVGDRGERRRRRDARKARRGAALAHRIHATRSGQDHRRQ